MMEAQRKGETRETTRAHACRCHGGVPASRCSRTKRRAALQHQTTRSAHVHVVVILVAPPPSLRYSSTPPRVYSHSHDTHEKRSAVGSLRFSRHECDSVGLCAGVSGLLLRVLWAGARVGASKSTGCGLIITLFLKEATYTSVFR